MAHGGVGGENVGPGLDLSDVDERLHGLDMGLVDGNVTGG